MIKTELVLALARCTFLACSEKELLATNLDNLESLTVLSIEDIGAKIGRFVKTRVWKPELLAEQVYHDIEVMEKYGISGVSTLDSSYPPLLRELPDAPFVIFWRGTLPDPERPLVAMVGTRSPSGEGALTAARIARQFADRGIAVVSGLANGIDTFAHRGNIDGGGASVAVLACGVERIYPRSNICLARKMIESGGCLLSEYSPLEPPLQYRFPQRNRIISGLARAVIIVEAPEKSGALITADFALEQGRDLYVCAQPIHSARSAGTRNLREQGAPAIRVADEILTAWNYTIPGNSARDMATLASGIPSGLTRQAAVGRQLALDFKKEIARQDTQAY